MASNSDFPKPVLLKMEMFEESLTNVEEVLKPFLKIPLSDLLEQIGDPLDQAKLKLMVAYTMNSLFWTYLVTQGIDPKSHPIKEELLRVKQYMGRVKSIEEKAKMSKIDTNAAKRFVRSALWEPQAQVENKKDEDQNRKRKKEKLEASCKESNIADENPKNDSPAKRKKKKKKKNKEGEVL